jgi:pilus assembly protein CpaB
MRRGGRLVLLLGLVLAGVAAVFIFFLLNQNATPAVPDVITAPTLERSTQVVVARADIPANTVLTDTELLALAEIPESQFNANPDQYFTSFDQLQTKKTISNVPATNPVLANNVTDAGLSLQIPLAQEGQPRPKAYPFQVNNLTGVADQITTGDFVDVIASIPINQIVLRPGFNEEGQVVIREQEFAAQSTKTLVQNVQVLRVLKPQAPAEGTPTPGAASAPAEGPPQTDEQGQPVDQTQGGTTQQTGDTFVPGSWILVLALTDQQAEIVKFSAEQGNGITLVLRGRGDTVIETTLGATLDLLISQFGLPLPQPFPPAVITNDQLTPIPTSAVATPVAPTPTP